MGFVLLRVVNFIIDNFCFKKTTSITVFNNKIVDTVCFELPNAFSHRKKHIISLPYVKDFFENKIPTKARPIQMNAEILYFCQKKLLIYLQRELFARVNPLGLVVLFMLGRMQRLREEFLD